MDRFVILGFLYFPEDKSSYIPAAIEMVFLVILCFLAFMWFKRLSKKQEQKTKDLEQRILSERQQNIQSKVEK
ncbi:hypothetical protein ACH0B5_14130 [Ureibacillus sp. 179-F W5.1 NHS]|uniref:Uncharacterized protein n=1 Tax=Lysinibacillus halotolerans TaxID=1368476 RepID=A0A3M8H928_9BACI|nr:hypothetical protein [Lysinibacillus halotolerans]RNC98734.1 hypothetical protein EC501_10225 [Lysinibacillus halotolerans]